jgi:hypothetical protein
MADEMSALPYRVRVLEDGQAELRADVDEQGKQLGENTSKLAVHDEQISGAGGLVNVVRELSGKVDSLNKALYTFALSFIVAALTIAIAVSQAGK